jgi:hypothetical protein
LRVDGAAFRRPLLARQVAKRSSATQDVLVERRVREDDDGLIGPPGLEIVLQPGALLGPDAEGALHAVVEARHRLHALHGRELLRGPEVLLDDAVSTTK